MKKIQIYILISVLLICLLLRFFGLIGVIGHLLFIIIYFIQLTNAKVLYRNLSINWLRFATAIIMGNVLSIAVLAAWPQFRQFQDISIALTSGLALNIVLWFVLYRIVYKGFALWIESKSVVVMLCVCSAMALFFIYV